MTVKPIVIAAAAIWVVALGLIASAVIVIAQEAKREKLIEKFPEKESREQFKRALALREKLIHEPEFFHSVASDVLYPRFTKYLKDEKAIARLLEPSFVHISCPYGETTVFGFYNVSQHIWVITWVNRDNEIVRARLSLGFEPKDEPENVAWFQLHKPGGRLMDSIDRALKIQSKAFLLVFFPTRCESSKEVDFAFTRHAAIATLWRNENAIASLGQKTIEMMNQETVSRHSLQGQGGVALTFVAETKEDPNADYITLHTLKSKPDVMLIQLWKVKSDEVQLINYDVGVIGAAE